ncbi:O-antigen ligase family protein [Lysobacter pythonis]|uniref:O-antigen ligase family protein n=1 Tax=Solilutibacter pythonis TaxID=2483112 RepID=A0A3M2I0G1_9GAMM|nr:O-antigen ligase [Lysobacter pythonis]RMH93119.1 O-antigen ligase family protein [Lysobacter pythonis]
MTTAPAPVSPDPPAPTGWRWAPWWVLAYVAFWPAARVSEAILSLGAIVALLLLAKARFRHGERLLSHAAWALTTALFFAYWLPQLFSTFDAIEPARALKKVLAGLRYLPFLWLVAIAVATADGRRKVFGGIVVVMLAWTLDLLVQGVSGGQASPLNGALDGLYEMVRGKSMCDGQAERGLDRLNGVFGTCNPVLGVLLASFSAFVLFAGWRVFGVRGWLLGAVLVGIAVLLAGARASWLTYALVLLFSGWHVLGWKKLLPLFAGGALVLVALALVHAPMRERIERTALLMQGSEAGVNSALSGRGRIWSAAGCMIREHPVNGVGVRDFRRAWAGCDPEPGVQPAWGEGPALHAHQLLLEILSETGFLGLFLWLAGAALAWRAWRWATPAARQRARPAMLALGVTTFPFNTHLAFHSAFWGGVFLLLVALYAGSLLARDETVAP